MLITRLHRFLITPIAKTPQSQRIFWFSLTLTFAILYSFIGMQEAFSGQYVVQDDARQHVFWMQRFLDPELFPNDLIADYYQSIAPDGYAGFYRLMAAVNIDPMLLNKLLPPILALIVTGYCFGCVIQILPVPLAGFIATLLLNQNLWMKDDLSSATSRAFLYPLLLAFLYYVMRRSLLPVCIVIVLQGLFYPPCVLLSVGILFLRLWRFSNGRLRLSQERWDYWFFGVGFGVSVLAMLPTALKNSEFGPVITGTQARSMLEFSQYGRSSFFLDNPWEFWFFGERSGLLPKDWRSLEDSYFLLVFALGLSLPILHRYASRFPLVKQLTSEVFVLLQVLLTSVGLFAAAHAVLFKLYLPSRYTHHSMRILMAIGGAIALTILFDAAFQACERRSQSRRAGVKTQLIMPGLALGLTILLGAGLTIYPTTWENFPDIGYEIGKIPTVYEFFKQQPKDTLIASLAAEGKNLPSFTERSVLTAREYSVPYHTGYYNQIRQRTIDLINAQYSPDLKQVQNFIQKYGIDFWLLEKTAFTPDYLVKNRKSPNRIWIRQYQPAAAEALTRLEQGIVPALANVVDRCSVHETEGFVVLQADCIAKVSPQ